jgi:hypothetical protein
MNILENAKEIAEIIKKYDDLELYQKIIDLRDEIFKLREENLGLKEKIKEMERAEEIRVSLVKDGNLYYGVLENGSKSGPYCLTCWDSDRKLINVIQLSTSYFSCNRCKQKIGKI